MNFHRLALLFIALLVTSCLGQSPERADWDEWAQSHQAYFTEGPSAVRKAVDYRYVEQGGTAFLVKPNDVMTISDNGGDGADFVGSVTHTPSGAMWKRGDPADKSLPEDGPISGLVILDERFAMIVSTEHLSLDENRTRILFFDDQADISDFKGLDFFPYSPKGVVPARFRPRDRLEPVLLETERGLTKRFFYAGAASFTYQNSIYSIPIYTMTDALDEIDYLFTGFTDATTGKTSYGVGRYLDIVGFDTYPPESVTLDFNRLYNPTCAQSDAYNCPLIPATIDAPVPYGERYVYEK